MQARTAHACMQVSACCIACALLRIVYWRSHDVSPLATHHMLVTCASAYGMRPTRNHVARNRATMVGALRAYWHDMPQTAFRARAAACNVMRVMWHAM